MQVYQHYKKTFLIIFYRYLAIAEKAAPGSANERPIVSIYDLQTMKKRKVCCYLETDCTEIVSVAFDQ